MSDSVDRADKVFAELSLDWSFSFGKPATEQEIEEYESATGIILPPTYRSFLQKYNGAHLFCSRSGSLSDTSWWADSGILVFGITALIEYRKSVYEFVYELSDTPNCRSPLPIAYLGRIGTGDFCSLDLENSIGSDSPVLDCDHDCPPDEWTGSIIANSFEEWLKKMFERVVEHRSPPEYWFEDTLYDDSLSEL